MYASASGFNLTYENYSFQKFKTNCLNHHKLEKKKT